MEDVSIGDDAEACDTDEEIPAGLAMQQSERSSGGKTKNGNEIKLSQLNENDYALFQQATRKEWQTNIDNGAIKVLPPEQAQKIRQNNARRIMQSRLLHVAKPVDDVSQISSDQILQCSPNGQPCKAKTRWIARGDRDPDIFSVCASSPVIHRDTFMMGLQAIASKRWRIHFADFSQAFTQGEMLQRSEPLFCEPPDRKLLNLPEGSLIRICKTVYGLVDAPYRWNQHLDKAFKSLGYKPSILDPCCYLLHSQVGDKYELDGIVMLATDDFIDGGNQRHQSRMRQLFERYKFGKWEHDHGRFCGKDVHQDQDGAIVITQEYYTELKCKEKISIERGLSNDTPCTLEQTKILREKVGALSWLSKETRVDLCGSVALLMQAFPDPTVGDLKTCNRLLKEAYLYKDIGIKIKPIGSQDLCIIVSSDAAWGNAKDEESSNKSQSGYVVMAADRRMLQGAESQFSLVGWKSHTLKRLTVSTLSAEAQGIVEGAAVARWNRYLLAEFFYAHLVSDGNLNWESMLEPLEFGLITDAKSVYDALTHSSGSSNSTDRRTAIDLSIIREYLRRHNGCIRWVDGKLQLADSLTKHMSADFLRSVLSKGTYQLREEYDAMTMRQQARQERQERKKSKEGKVNQ